MITFPHIGFIGRLGNQMFQYSALVGIADKYGLDYALARKNIQLYECFDIDTKIFSFYNKEFHCPNKLNSNVVVDGHVIYIPSEEIQEDRDLFRKILLYQCYTSEEKYNENFSKLLNTISMSNVSAVVELVNLFFFYKNEDHIFSLLEEISDEEIKINVLEYVLMNHNTHIDKKRLLHCTEGIKSDGILILLKKAWIYMFYKEHDSAMNQLSKINAEDLLSTEAFQSLPSLLHSFTKMELNTLKIYAPFISEINSTICYSESLTLISESLNNFFAKPIPFQVLIEDILNSFHISEKEDQIPGELLLPLFVIKQIVKQIYPQDSFDLSNEIEQKIEYIINILQKNTHIFKSDDIIPFFLFLENHGSLDSEYLKSFFRNIRDSETKIKCIGLYLNNFLEKAKKHTEPFEFFEKNKEIIAFMIEHLNIQDDRLSNYIRVFLDIFCEIMDTDKTFQYLPKLLNSYYKISFNFFLIILFDY